MKTSLMLLALATALVLPIGAASTQSAGDAVLVTPDNFKRAETDMYFAMFVKRGALGTFIHFRELPLEGTGVRPNRDTLYSQAVFDLDAGPVTITLPPPAVPVTVFDDVCSCTFAICACIACACFRIFPILPNGFFMPTPPSGSTPASPLPALRQRSPLPV